MSAEDFVMCYVLAGVENSRLSGVRYLGVALVTAATILFGVWLLSISLPSAVFGGKKFIHYLYFLFFFCSLAPHIFFCVCFFFKYVVLLFSSFCFFFFFLTIKPFI